MYRKWYKQRPKRNETPTQTKNGTKIVDDFESLISDYSQCMKRLTPNYWRLIISWLILKLFENFKKKMFGFILWIYFRGAKMILVVFGSWIFFVLFFFVLCVIICKKFGDKMRGKNDILAHWYCRCANDLSTFQ